MIDEGKITNQEALTMAVVITVTELFLTFMAELVSVGQTGTWQILLLSAVFAGAFYLPAAALMEGYPGKSLVEVGEELAGPYLNGLFVFIYLVICLGSSALVIRQYAERVLTISIPELPVSVAVAVMYLGSLVACHLGLEAMARSSFFIIYFIGFTVLLASVLTYPYWCFDYLFPLAGPGVGKVVKEGVFRSSLMCGVPLFLGLIFPSLKKPAIRLAGLGAFAIGGLTMSLTMLAMLMTFGVSALQEMVLPTYEMTRLIYFGRFLQRLESIFVPVWALLGMMYVAFGTYVGSIALTRYLRLPYHRPFLLPVAVLTYALALLPANAAQTFWLDFHLLRAYGFLPAFFLPALLFGLDRLKKKGMRRGGGKGGGSNAG